MRPKRTRKEKRMDQKVCYSGLEKRADAHAKECFLKPPYQAKEIKRMDILTYMRLRTKGERGIEQEDP